MILFQGIHVSICVHGYCYVSILWICILCKTYICLPSTRTRANYVPVYLSKGKRIYQPHSLQNQAKKFIYPPTIMGVSSSKPEQKKNDTPFCEDCQKDKQRPLPSRDNISSDGKPCADLYDIVDSCMKKYNGQISTCQDEWSAFRRCHDENRITRERVN